MKKLKSIFAILVVVVLFTSCTPEPPCSRICNNGGKVNSNCGCDCPNGYTGDNCQIAPIPSCSRLHTATVTFRNNSANHTYVIVWDGSVIATVLPGQVSIAFVESAGTHTVKFKIIETGIYTATSNPNLLECSTQEFYFGG